MSLVLEEHRQSQLNRGQTNNNLSPSQNSQNDLSPPSKRFGTRIGTKIRVLRADSPTTIEACKELGVLIPELKQKTIEEFKNPNVENEINELRFNHYMKKYNQMIKDVFAKKRELVKAQQRANKLKQIQPIEVELSPSKSKLSPTGAIFSVTALPVLNQNASSITQITTPTPAGANFGKALSYFRNSHNTSEVRDFIDITGNEVSVYGLENASSFDAALANEVAKFNKIKMRKQAEAKNVFEEEIKRAQLVEGLKEKEKRLKEVAKKQAVEKKLAKEDKRRKAEEKLEKIRDLDKVYQNKKVEERERMQLKLTEAKEKLAQEATERRRILTEQEERFEQRKRAAEERTARVKMEEQFKCDELLLQINEKLYRSEEKHHLAITDKISRARLQVQKVEDSARLIREQQKQQEEENTQRLVEKLVKKDTDIKTFHDKQIKELKKREKEAASKSARFFNHQADLKQTQKDKVSDINEKALRVQEELKAKKEQNEKSLRIRQEMNKLRILDKQENYQRNIRQIEYEQEKVLFREKLHQEKLAAIKAEKEAVKQAKIESSIQAKLEQQKIDNALIQLSKITEVSTGSTLNEPQRRILKEILKPHDFKEIEDEEKRKKQEKLDMLSGNKSGLLSPAANKHQK